MDLSVSILIYGFRIRTDDSDPDPTLSFYRKLSSESHKHWSAKTCFLFLFYSQNVCLGLIKCLPLYLTDFLKKKCLGLGTW